MTKYLILWELDTKKMPNNLKEILPNLSKMLEMVKIDMEAGRIIDFGSFVGESAGYCIVEGTEKDVTLETSKYMPYLITTVRAVMTVNQKLDVVNTLASKMA